MAEYILVSGVRICTIFREEKFSKLTVIGPRFRIGKAHFCVCKCDCGELLVINPKLLRKKRSCGCIVKANAKTHGLSFTYFAHVYHGMINRCYRKTNHNYSDYGGRGIKVCDRWLGSNGLANFAADMGERPSAKHSIDRKENGGDYCPDNCRWATNLEQNRNRRNTVLITFQGKTQCVVAWSEELGIPHATIYGRLKRGLPIDVILGKRKYLRKRLRSCSRM